MNTRYAYQRLCAGFSHKINGRAGGDAQRFRANLLQDRQIESDIGQRKHGWPGYGLARAQMLISDGHHDTQVACCAHAHIKRVSDLWELVLQKLA